MGKQVFLPDMLFFYFFLVLWASGFFFDLSAPSYISSHENESAEIFGKNLLGYEFCCK